MRRLLSAAVVAVALLHAPPARGQADAPPIKDGDRVVLLGGGLIEHEQFHGYLETRLTRRLKSVTFRNLGWGGDTVRGVARTGGFQNPDGFARLLKEVQAQKPTVLLICYGTNESFAGPKGLPSFLEGYENLLERLAPAGAREIVVLSPTFHEDLGRPFPDPAEHNRHLAEYTAALAKLAARRKVRFVDLFHPLVKAKEADPKRRLTENGLLPNATGYWLLAAEAERQLLGALPAWEVTLDGAGKVAEAKGAKVEAAEGGPGRLRFHLTPAVLPAPAGPDGLRDGPPTLRVTGLAPGENVLRVGGRVIVRATAEEWARGVRLPADPSQTRAEELRKAVAKKSDLFYRRWRPFNDHERHFDFLKGDFALYDAQVAEQEALIERLRRPAALSIQIVAKEGAR